jgi:hypothetical protein
MRARTYGQKLNIGSRRGNGPRGLHTTRVLPLRHELLRIASETPVEPKERKLKGHKTIRTDDQVRDARRLYETGGKTLKDICSMFHITLEYARKLMAYEVRSKVLP